MGIPVIDRPREGLDDPGLPPLPPDPDPGGEPTPPSAPREPRTLKLIAWNIALVVSVPAVGVIVKIISHAS
jgi:hypothetical protein